MRQGNQKEHLFRAGPTAPQKGCSLVRAALDCSRLPGRMAKGRAWRWNWDQRTSFSGRFQRQCPKKEVLWSVRGSGHTQKAYFADDLHQASNYPGALKHSLAVQSNRARQDHTYQARSENCLARFECSHYLPAGSFL